MKVRFPILTGLALFTTLEGDKYRSVKTVFRVYLDFLLPRQWRSIAMGGRATNQPTRVALPSGRSLARAWSMNESKYSLVSRCTGSK